MLRVFFYYNNSSISFKNSSNCNIYEIKYSINCTFSPLLNQHVLRNTITFLNSIKKYPINKSKLNYVVWYCIVIAALFLVSACSKTGNNEVLKIGFSQCTMADEWRKQMVQEMEREAALYNNIDIQIFLKDAQNNSQKQKKDIEKLIAQEVDILIISPNQSDPLVETIELANKSGIPIVIIDRIIETDLPFYAIGGNNFNIGKMAGEEAQRLLPNGGNILVVSGLAGSTPAVHRQNGFEKAILRNNLINISVVIECDWTEELAEKQLFDFLKNDTDFDLIFSHNDFMAKGVIKALKSKSNKNIPIIGIDGLNTPGCGIDMVLDSVLSATITYPTGGDKAIETAYKIFIKEEVSKKQELNSVLITLTNATNIREQRNEIEQQHLKIDRQLVVLSDKDDKINAQKRQLTRVIILMSSLGLFLFVVIYFSWKPLVVKINKLKYRSLADKYAIPISDNANDNEKKFLQDIQEVIDKNITNTNLSVQFIGEELGMSHSTIYRKIKKVTGMKSVELINHIRLNHATKLLLSSDLSSEEIAYQSGFNTSSYFSTCFQKRHNLSPIKYRERKKHSI